MFSTESLKHQVTVSLIGLVALFFLVLFGLVWRGLITMTDSLLYVSEAIPLVLGFMGVLIALHEDWAKRNRWWVIGAFVVVSGLGFYANVKHRERLEMEASKSREDAAIANTKLADSIKNLGSQTNQIVTQGDEIKRVERLNTGLQNKLLDQSGQLIDSGKRISDLSKEAIATTTGGESYCYMYLDTFTSSKGPFPTFIHQGNQPLYDIHVRISDLHKLEDIKGSMTVDQLFSTGPAFTVGDLAPTSTKMEFDQIITLSDSPRQDFNIFFDARNGYWDENLRMRKVGNNWLEAIRVMRDVRHKHGKTTMKVIYERIPKEFPKPFDWNNLKQ